jgi:hypothetical protein
MHPDDSKDPLEGKGEEMVPDRGMPFTDIDESVPEIDDPLAGIPPQASEVGKTEPETMPPEGSERPPEVTGIPPDAGLKPGEIASTEDQESDSQLAFFDSVQEKLTQDLDEVELEEATPPGDLEGDVFLTPDVEAALAPHPAPEGGTSILSDLASESIESTPTAELVFSEELSSRDLTAAELEAIVGDSEAVLAIDSRSEPATLGVGEHLIESTPGRESILLADYTVAYSGAPKQNRPPEGYPDEGMGTASEEAILAGEITPDLLDGGMSAGYPPLGDADLLPEPGVPIEKPDPAAMSGAPLFSTGSFLQPGPGPAIGSESGLTQDSEQTAQPAIVDMLVTEAKIKDLWERADKAHKLVNEHINNLQLAQKSLDYIQMARNELMGGPENYEEAERFINEVEYRIELIKKIRKFPKWYIPRLYLYEIVWAIAFLLVLVLFVGIDTAFAGSKIEGIPDAVYLLSSMIWGGFGGVVGALLALVKHFSIEQDFDTQHTWWYLSSPAIGIGIGAVVYLFMHVGLFAIIGSEGDIASPLIIYVFAWLAGYQQNIFTDLVKRMMKTLMGEDLKSQEEVKIKG